MGKRRPKYVSYTFIADVGTLSPELSPIDYTLCNITCQQSDGSQCLCDIDTAEKLCLCNSNAMENGVTSNQQCKLLIFRLKLILNHLGYLCFLEVNLIRYRPIQE